MYYLTKMCYCCLAQTVNLIKIDNSGSTNPELGRAITSLGLNVYWLNINHIMLICKKCCLKIRETFEFISVCQKNNKIVQSFLNLLNNGKENKEGKGQLDVTGPTKENKRENHEEDNAVEYEEIVENRTVNSCRSNIDIITKQTDETVAGTTEAQCLIKSEMKIEPESVECSKSSLEKTEILIDQLHSELDIKEHFSYGPTESEEECDMHNSIETLVSSEMSLNHFEHTDDNITANCISETRNIVNQRKENASNSASTKGSHRCSQCNKCLSSKSSLDRHFRVHSGEQPYNCSICTKKFSIKCNLDCHMLIHNDARLFECLICSKRFTHKRSLYAHKSVHTGNKPYKCPICNRNFAHKCTLNNHVRTHTGEKPFKCLICNKDFICKSQLNKHMKIHITE